MGARITASAEPTQGDTQGKKEDQTHLWLVAREVTMRERKPFEADRELDIAASDHVLDLEVGELGLEAELLDDARVLPPREARVVLALCARDDHLAASEDESRRLWLPHSHNNGRESLLVIEQWDRNIGGMSCNPDHCSACRNMLSRVGASGCGVAGAQQTSHRASMYLNQPWGCTRHCERLQRVDVCPMVATGPRWSVFM